MIGRFWRVLKCRFGFHNWSTVPHDFTWCRRCGVIVLGLEEEDAATQIEDR